MGRQVGDCLLKRARRVEFGSSCSICFCSRSSIIPVVGGADIGGNKGTCPGS